MKVKAKPIRTKYWLPGDDYLKIIVDVINNRIIDGDIITISEKAISVAKGNLIDESIIKPSPLSRFIAGFWMRIIWGNILSRLSRLKKESIRHMKNYPIRAGSAHKQLALRYGGLLQALKHGSEGGIDTSNLPYAYSCLPLKKPEEEVIIIQREIRNQTGRNVTVVIIDTDSTFTWHNFHFSSRPRPFRGIKSFGGVLSFTLGRVFKLKERATPLASAGSKLSTKDLLDIAEFAHHTRGYGSGRTIWDMARRFGVGLSDVTWEMLEEVDHYPIVLIRERSRFKKKCSFK